VKRFVNMKTKGIHIHCPEGAVSKDGPSAGTAIVVAMYSLLNKIPIKYFTAITGEITLQGKIMAIGGLEHKIMGGIRAGIRKFVFPEDNHKDFELFLEKMFENGYIYSFPTNPECAIDKFHMPFMNPTAYSQEHGCRYDIVISGKDIEFILVSNIDQVFPHVLEK
jgi:predicted ATP-dependent protease